MAEPIAIEWLLSACTGHHFSTVLIPFFARLHGMPIIYCPVKDNRRGRENNNCPCCLPRVFICINHQSSLQMTTIEGPQWEQNALQSNDIGNITLWQHAKFEQCHCYIFGPYVDSNWFDDMMRAYLHNFLFSSLFFPCKTWSEDEDSCFLRWDGRPKKAYQ